jgi:hypothetical protein
MIFRYKMVFKIYKKNNSTNGVQSVDDLENRLKNLSSLKSNYSITTNSAKWPVDFTKILEIIKLLFLSGLFYILLCKIQLSISIKI